MDTIGGVDRILGNHRETVFALCLRVLRHRQDAEDACQEVLLKLARHGPGESDPSRLAAWIHQVALRTAIDHHRAKMRRKAREDKAAERVPSQAAESDSMIPIAEALSELPEEERTLIIDHFFARKTLRALADERGCSEPAVWKRVEKSKDRLRKALKAAAPAAVLALSGFLEAAERPSRWSPWRLAVAAAIPAIVVAGFTVVGVQRRRDPEPAPRVGAPVASAAAVPLPPSGGKVRVPTVAPTLPVQTSTVVPPYPYELPPRHWSDDQRPAWLKVEQTRIDVFAENMMLHEVLGDLSTRSGLLIRLTPDTPVPTGRFTFKTKDLSLKQTLKLLVMQYDLDFHLGSDGTVWIASAETVSREPDPRFEEIRSVRDGLDFAVRAMDGGTHGIPADPVWAALNAKEILIPAGNYTLGQVVDRLRQESGVDAHLNVSVPTGDPDLDRREAELIRKIMDLDGDNRILELSALAAELHDIRSRNQKAASRPFQGGVRTLESHLQELETAWTVGWAPTDGVLLILDPPKAAEEIPRAKEHQRKNTESAVRLDQAVLDPLPTTVFQLADALARDTGLKVVPSENAWAAPLRTSGETWKRVLETLPAQGFRWLLRDGTVYIDR